MTTMTPQDQGCHKPEHAAFEELLTTAQGPGSRHQDDPTMKHTVKDAAIRWAKAGSILNPGIMFSAIVGDEMYSYETDETGRVRSVA